MVTPGKLNRRAELFQQIAGMIAAGLPLTRALETAAKNRSLGLPPNVLLDLNAQLKQGHTFADAMQLASGQTRAPRAPAERPRGGIEVAITPTRKGYWLSDFDVALLSAGEASGKLDTSLRTLSRYYAARAQMIRDAISGSVITMITLHVFLMVFPVGLLQQFARGIIDNQYSQCWPFIIEKIIAFSVLYGAIWAVASAGDDNRSLGWRSLMESIFSFVPLLRTAVKYLATARLAMALDALLNAGVPVIKSWNLAAAASGSPHLKRQILKRTPTLEQGVTPAEMISEIKYLPETFNELYYTGEISGKLDETLTRSHTYFEEEGFRKLKAFYLLVQYVIYFTIAIIVAVFVIKFWLGYFQALQNIL